MSVTFSEDRTLSWAVYFLGLYTFEDRLLYHLIGISSLVNIQKVFLGGIFEQIFFTKFLNHKKGSPKGAGTPVIAFFANADDALIIPYADGANQMREDYQFYHVYGGNVQKFGGKVGELRLYQKPHLQSKFDKPVSLIKTPYRATWS